MLQTNRISPFPEIQNSSSCRYTTVFFSVSELRTTDPHSRLDHTRVLWNGVWLFVKKQKNK